MKNACILLLSLVVLVSCKKHELRSLLGRDGEDISLKSAVIHPIDMCNSGDPIGGGAGYSRIVNPANADVIISSPMSPSSFKTLIESSANKTIYIASGITIDLTGLTSTINLPPNIVIASNRGLSGSQGALIKTSTICPYYASCSYTREVFTSNGNNIRFTGIRLQGPYDQEGSVTMFSMAAILMKGNDGLEVDNCELFAWPEAAIYIGRLEVGNHSNNNNRIHHNYIHSNKHHGLGYGVCVDNGYAEIKSNIFQNNRHDITSSGYRNTNNTGYEAACNIVLGGGSGHNFDVHGENGDDLPNASTFFYIHHNYFATVGETIDSQWPKQNIVIRGRPDNQCRIENNIFKHAGPSDAIKQHSYGAASGWGHTQGNLLVFNNVYGYGLNGAPGSYLGWYVKPTWTKKGVSNFVNLTSTNDQLMASIGLDNIIDYAFGDYNGDGKTDIYKIENGRLYVIPYEITNGITQGWTQLTTTTYLIPQLRFGHYNSDNVTDMIVKDGSIINISYGCNTPWTLFNSTGYPMISIHSGDLTGDGIEDFFCADGGYWRMINNAVPNSSWTTIASKNENSNVLRLGWFDLNITDNKIDVFHADGYNFYSSYNGTLGWTNLGNSSYTIPALSVYDFDSDGISDVIYNSSRQVSLKGRMSWANTTLNNFPLSTFTYGDFN